MKIQAGCDYDPSGGGELIGGITLPVIKEGVKSIPKGIATHGLAFLLCGLVRSD